MNRLLRTTLWPLLLCSALLVGCAGVPKQAPPGTAVWTGRIGLQILTQPPQSIGAAFELQGSAEQGELLLLSPIGSTLAQLSWTPTQAHLTQGGRQWSSQSLDDLTTQLAGTALPVAALFDWLAGQATPLAGWQIDLSQRAEGRIQAERKSPDPVVQLKLVLEQ
jgi:outer membrane lipoprotein LolB